MAAPSSSALAKTQIGLSFTTPAPENFVFSAEHADRRSRVSAARVPRIIDSFAFMVNKDMAPLSVGWHTSQCWDDVRLVGAVASLKGEESFRAQAGWFARIKWRWMHIEKIELIRVASDPRFRAGEKCFWLRTKIGEYAMLTPHTGYSTDWAKSLRGVLDVDAPPLPQRFPPDGFMPIWWPANAPDSWRLAATEAREDSFKRTPPPTVSSSGPPSEGDSAEQSPTASSSRDRSHPVTAGTAPVSGLDLLWKAVKSTWDVNADITELPEQPVAPEATKRGKKKAGGGSKPLDGPEPEQKRRRNN
ncbi:hypothetical protein FRC12_001638 [Ceratobasidium sp. 428]|nr:hypothetical protein FRC12_001638 [Ceratobasidium sp. 428]